MRRLPSFVGPVSNVLVLAEVHIMFLFHSLFFFNLTLQISAEHIVLTHLTTDDFFLQSNYLFPIVWQVSVIIQKQGRAHQATVNTSDNC